MSETDRAISVMSDNRQNIILSSGSPCCCSFWCRRHSHQGSKSKRNRTFV